MSAKLVRGANLQVEFTASGAKAPGQVIQVAGKAAVVAGSRTVADGERGMAYIDGIWDVDAASALTVTAGDILDVDVAGTGSALADGGTGTDGYLGQAVAAKANGETTVRVWLNAPAAQ